MSDNKKAIIDLMGKQLANYSLSDIYDMLRARGQFNRFLSYEHRDLLIEGLNEYREGWIRYESSSEIFEKMCVTRLSNDVNTDQELIKDCLDLIGDLEDNEEAIDYFSQEAIDIILSHEVEKEVLDA